MRFSVTLKSFAMAAFVLGFAATAVAKDVQLAVVPVHAKPNKAFDASVVRLLDKPLKRQADLIPAKEFAHAAKRAHVKPMAMALPRNLKSVGKAVGATHVLVIELTGKGRGATANTTLFDVTSGRTVLTDSYPLTGPKLTPEVASQMLAPVLDAIGAGANKDADAAPEVAEEDADKPKAKMGKGGFAFPGKGGKDDEAAADEDKGGDEDKASDDEGEAADATAKAEHDPADQHNTPFRISLGATFLQRDAHIIPGVAAAGTPPCYCGTGNNANPFFPAPELALEIFPMAFMHPGAPNWYDHLGLQADFFFTKVNSYVDTNPADTISSTVYNYSLAAVYRLNWFDTPTSPDTYFHLGYNSFAFPLLAGAFPGVQYSSPFVGAQVHVPMPFLEQLSLVGGADFQFLTQAGGDSATLLGKEASGFGFNAGGGARFTIDHFELSALYHYQMYNVAYTGATALTARGAGNATVPVYQNVTLKDALNEVTLMVGYRF